MGVLYILRNRVPDKIGIGYTFNHYESFVLRAALFFKANVARDMSWIPVKPKYLIKNRSV